MAAEADELSLNRSTLLKANMTTLAVAYDMSQHVLESVFRETRSRRSDESTKVVSSGSLQWSGQIEICASLNVDSTHEFLPARARGRQ